MVVMTCGLGFGLAQLVSLQDAGASRLGVLGLTVLGMAAAYGLVCGAMMFAGEREAGTMVFLDIFSGRRGQLWVWKSLLGVVWALSEALAVGLVLHLLKQGPPPWLPTLVGVDVFAGAGPRDAARSWPAARAWFVVLPAVTLEAYAWGLFGSVLTRRVLSGAALGILITAPFWLIF